MQNQNQEAFCFDCLDPSASLRIAGETQLLSLVRLYNLGLAAVVTSLNACGSEAECICVSFLGLKKVEGTRSVSFYARRLFWAFPLGLDKVAHC